MSFLLFANCSRRRGYNGFFPVTGRIDEKCLRRPLRLSLSLSLFFSYHENRRAKQRKEKQSPSDAQRTAASFSFLCRRTTANNLLEAFLLCCFVFVFFSQQQHRSFTLLLLLKTDRSTWRMLTVSCSKVSASAPSNFLTSIVKRSTAANTLCRLQSQFDKVCGIGEKNTKCQKFNR